MREAAPGRAGRAPEAASRGGPAAEGPRGRAIAPAPTSRNAMATGQRSGAGSARRSADITALRGNVQAPRRFHANAYRPPAGFVSRRWAYGERLPRAYFARNYWITNFLLFGLFGPPPGFVWVRVGPDALLIDEFTGEIVRVEYGVFY
jgi:Ni/Co efflux regulator RcnB